MDTKKLRQKILDLAIHGKLVPQDPNDEPASVLLEHIKAEKERLIKEGKIKGSKKSAKASDMPHYENVPFEVPSSWVWCRLEDYVKSVTDGDHQAPPKSDIGIPFFVISDIANGKLNFSNSRFVPREYYEKISFERKPQKGDLLFSVTGSYGIVVPVNTDDEFCFQRHIGLLKTLNTSDYLLYLLKSDYIKEECDNLATGTAQKTVGLEILRSFLLPIPPLAEQHRIVAEIERWFSLIDQIEQSKDDLETTVKQAKSKILDLAIHGKLVPQDPNDEPAIELLKRINPDYTPCDNGHDKKLPQNWTWAEGKNIFLPMKSTKPKDEEFQYIDIDSIDNKRQIISEVKTLKTSNAPSRASRYTQKNDVIFSMVRPYLRNIAKVNNDNCIASTGFYVCSSNPRLLNSDYCYYLMISDYVVNGLNQFMKGDNSPSINKGHIDEWLFQLPPLAEQHRIVQRIKVLFSYLDEIQTALEV